ncbi:MAG TPA: reverse transcriptase domain-containing protein, partial [Oculatellaceae cyanobacterium]
MIIAIHVDDIFIICNSKQLYCEKRDKLARSFKMTFTENPKEFLGMRITTNEEERTVCLDQQAYALRTLERYDMQECRPVSTAALPDRSNNDFPEAQEPTDTTLYQQIVGSLMYLAYITRPDIAIAVHRLCLKMNAPTKQDLVKAKRVLRYLSDTHSYGLKYKYE